MQLSYKTKISLIVAIFLWASAFVCIRVGLQGYTPEGLALLRYLIASICMGVVYYRLPQKKLMHFKDIAALLSIGAVGIGIYNVMLNHGELSVSSGMASFITSQSPMITTLFAMIFFGERLKFLSVMGFFISLLGILFIALGESGGFKWSGGVSYVLIATLAASCYSILQKPYLKKCHVIEATTYVIWGGALFLLMYAPQLHHDLVNASFKTTVIVIYLGIFPAAVGYIAWSYVLAEMPVARAVSFFYFMPFLATLLGWVWLGETPVRTSLLGGLFAITGVWLVNRAYFKPSYNGQR